MKFKATCHMHDPRSDRLRLTPEEWETHQGAGKPGRGTFDYGTKMWNVEQHCDFATSDVAELREHLKSVHDNKKRWRGIDRGKVVGRIDRINANLTQRPMHPKWRGPSLKDEGRPFEPTGLDLGARIEWEGRTGQVWSLGHEPRSVWIIPDEPSVQSKEGAGTRHELAALLVVTSSGRLSEQQTSWSSWKSEAA